MRQSVLSQRKVICGVKSAIGMRLLPMVMDQIFMKFLRKFGLALCGKTTPSCTWCRISGISHWKWFKIRFKIEENHYVLVLPKPRKLCARMEWFEKLWMVFPRKCVTPVGRFTKIGDTHHCYEMSFLENWDVIRTIIPLHATKLFDDFSFIFVLNFICRISCRLTWLCDVQFKVLWVWYSRSICLDVGYVFFARNSFSKFISFLFFFSFFDCLVS